VIARPTNTTHTQAGFRMAIFRLVLLRAEGFSRRQTPKPRQKGELEKKKMETAIQYVGLRKSCTLCTQHHVACNG
jgi:hypothetical protein